MKQTVYIETLTTDPDFNLALEEYVFNHMPRDKEYLMTWRNDNAIIIGRHQNTLSEIDESYVRKQGIRVVRRLSGGGAVYHDLGNLNFTFIVDDNSALVDLHRFCLQVAEALKTLGVDAQVDGRNDILVNGHKISGNAQYRKEGRVMHHGTLLFDSDLTILGAALKPDPEKIQAKGVKSVRSRVGNIRALLPNDMTLPQFREHLANTLLSGIPHSRYTLTEEDIAAVEAIRAERYGTWQWNYGTSPACTLLRKRRIEGCGNVQAYLALEHGCIQELHFRGDYFSTDDPEILAEILEGAPLTEEGLRAALKGVDTSRFITGIRAEDLICLLLEL